MRPTISIELVAAVAASWWAPARISSFDQKPASGKMPARASVPMHEGPEGLRHVLAQAAHVLLHVEAVVAAWLTEPAPRNRQALKKAWVKRWKTAAVQAPTPSAITM